ncbi:MAG: hypothetical protein ACI399_06785 [Candidatus Cryptobacteroides sp.]
MRVRKKVGGHIEKYLIPKVTKQAVDFLLGFLDMGTWTVVGDITRVYRGADCEYKGWQRNTVTTPDALFRAFDEPAGNPFWAELAGLGKEEDSIPADCSPEESRRTIIEHLTGLFPGEKEKFEMII